MSFLRGAPLFDLDSSKSFLLIYSSYQQPQVCRGCLVGILMRQLTEDSAQSLQLEPKPRSQRAKRRRVDIYLWTLITKRIFLQLRHAILSLHPHQHNHDLIMARNLLI